MTRLITRSLPENWVWVRIGDVCKINPLLESDEIPAPDTKVTFLPMAAVDEVDGRIAFPTERDYREVSKGFTSFRNGDVLFAKITPSMENGKAAIAENLVNGLGFGSTEFHVLRPSWVILAEWIFAFVRQEIFRKIAAQNFIGTAGQQRVPAEFLERFQIPLPPLPEQEYIAPILRHVDNLRRQRREADELAQKILPALFYEMFGDPATNSKGWPVLPVSTFVKEFQGGRSVYASSQAQIESKYRVLKVSAVTWKEYQPEESKPVPSGYIPDPEHIVKPNDLLFSRANTTELVGATSYVFDTPPSMLLPDKLWRFVWHSPSEVEPLFVWALFQTPAIRRELGRLATGTGGSMKNISMPKVLAMRVPFPPMSLQTKFAAIYQAFRNVEGQQFSSRFQLNELFSTILSRSFTGELTEAWRDQHEAELRKAAETRDEWLKEQGHRVTKDLTDIEDLSGSASFETHPRYPVLRELQNSPEQWQVYQTVAQTSTPFTIQNLAETCDLPAATVRRHLALLEALGVVGRASYPLNTSEQLHYAPLYRLLTEADDARIADLDQLQQAFSTTGGSDSL